MRHTARAAAAALAALVSMAGGAPVLAQTSPSPWNGAYAGGDVSIGSARAAPGADPCRVGCGPDTPEVGAHAGYTAPLGSGFFGGLESDVGASTRR